MKFFVALVAVGIALFVPKMFAFAHPLDVAFFDFSHVAKGTVLTVAIHPYQAYELLRGADRKPFDLQRLRSRGDLISAYVQNHVQIEGCTWDAGDAHVPDTELDAVADGVTVIGPVECGAMMPEVLTVTTDLFLDRFPNQTAILRLEYPDGFAEKKTLDRTVRSAQIDVRDLFYPPTGELTPGVASASLREPISRDGTAFKGRTPDALLADAAKRVLDPELSFWSFLTVLLAVAAIGALHALGPGHGKSLMAATMVGSHATYGRVLILGTIMTLTHVADVFLMALFAGLISAVVPQTKLPQYLEIVSACGLVIMGCVSLRRAITRYRLIRNNPEAGALDEAHRRAHELGLPHTHEHAHEPHGHDHTHPDETKTFRQALWMGFLGSLAPCPSAWAVFLATLATGHVWSGIALLVAFTVGLHSTILVIGFLIIASSSFVLRKTSPRITYAVPIASAGIIIAIGGLLLVRSW